MDLHLRRYREPAHTNSMEFLGASMPIGRKRGSVIERLPAWMPWSLAAFFASLLAFLHVYSPSSSVPSAVIDRFLRDRRSTLVSYAYFEKDAIQVCTPFSKLALCCRAML